MIISVFRRFEKLTKSDVVWVRVWVEIGECVSFGSRASLDGPKDLLEVRDFRRGVRRHGEMRSLDPTQDNGTEYRRHSQRTTQIKN